MQQVYTIPSGRNALSESGILRVYFDAFSSKNRYGTTFTSDYDQGCFIVFECCSFTGKERDEETGYGYFGARYMDHELMAMWLSVDPMADKYPSISPYNYCMWNPIKLVDPDGKDTIKIHIDKGAIEILASDGNHRINYYRNGELIDSYSIEKDECTFRTRSIDYENTDQKIDCRTYHLYCSNDKIGEQIFNKIASLGSPVEWDYYSIRVNEETINGDLSSSGIEDKMVHSPGMYTEKNVLFWDHYHPNNSSDSFYPSHKDQDHVKLLKGARCTIFHGGKSMDFQNYVPTGDNKYISGNL